MPRTARSMVPRGHYDVMNRGSNRATIFASRDDYAAFVRHTGQAQAQVAVLAVCLMPNHFHLVLVQAGACDISRWMHWLLTTYGTHHHERHGSSCRLWQGRFKAFPIEQDAQLLTVMRYVERNALRSGLVRRAGIWPWGSLVWRQRGASGPTAMTRGSAGPPVHGRDWTVRPRGRPRSRKTGMSPISSAGP